MSLIEAVLAMLILTTAIAAIVGGMSTSIVSSDMQRKSVTADAVVRSWAEGVDAAGYQPCATNSTSQYQPGAVGVNVPARFRAEILSVAYWNGSNSAGFNAGTCSTDPGVQRITFLVSSRDGRGAEKIELVKRRDAR